MAASTSSPSGFSYAQAARGKTSTATSQAPSSKVTSGTATPATGTFSELGPNSNWADDVESTAGEKSDVRKTAQEQSKPAPTKDDAVEGTKTDARLANGTSGAPSPDLVATPNTATASEDSSSAPQTNGSSETTWDTKSDNSAQNSEPSWIAARKERQDHDKDGKGSDRPARKGKKGDKASKESEAPKPEPKPVVYTEAAPPSVNPWAIKRVEAPKPVPVAVPQAPKPAPPAVPVPAMKENQRPRADSRKKANSITGLPRDAENSSDTKKPSVPQGKRFEEKSQARQGSKLSTECGRNDATPPPAKAQREHQSLPNLHAVPPSVKDETSWPTPDKAERVEDKERKDIAEKEKTSEGAEGESNAKPREKTKWTQIPVTPTIVWATEEMNRPPRGSGGDRGGRGGTSTRGRGGARGGPNGAKGGDRAATKKESSPSDADNAGATSRGRSDIDREAMPPPAKPSRKATASGSRAGSQVRGQSLAKTSANPALEDVSAKGVTQSQRTSSPAKLAASEDVKAPEPIPRSSKDAGVKDVREGADANREAPVRRVPSDSKKDRNFESYNGKEWTGAPRGSKRGGRGRGGSREFANGHQSSQPFTNGHAEFTGPYGAPHSPSAFQSPRGNFGFAQPGRGSWRGNPRSQSIPIDQVYGGRFGYGPAVGIPPVQTYYPGMYDYSGMPMSAIPYAQVAEQQYLFEMVSTQLEYYFSIDNLLKDMYLRKNMDSQGFVFLDVISNFNRIKQLSADPNLLKAVCLRSETIEIKTGDDGKDRLRRQDGWEQFVMPMDQREPAAQTEGPKTLMRPEPPAVAFPPPVDAFRGPASAGLPGSQRRSYDAGYAMNGAVPGFAPFAPAHDFGYGDATRGDEDRGRATKSPVRENGSSQGMANLSSPIDAKDGEGDVFPDEQASTLTVILKLGLQKPQHAAARTFSNGSIDTRSIFGELEKAGDDAAKPATNGEPATNGDHSTPDISRHASPSQGRSPEKGVNNELPLLWIKNSERPHEALPAGTTLEPYVHLRLKALKQRDEASTGNCPYDLDVLYQFWSHFLIRNYNHRMYGEFKYYATDDAQNRNNNTGMQNLLQFYAKALASSTPIRDHIVRDYVELVKIEPASTQGQGFKQLRQAWRNGALNLKNRKKLNDIVDEDLRTRLES
ncbi:putative HTH La-type RNA-binding protein [Cercospora beticola]|uniref:Putative HTH La-type RNA-binding protein n=1 Tax=Cercospora beticola TaxID=122368 RepID=A0A2G5ICF8_CERBT|nr:putative HTH La-type RNA-binding protein [Cercospora beticola]PIB02498.1 putative HTH La-type RNA-binding protein [Cercospora beticola]CAK1355462.1 unnamed protein product [Cercospora beticola]